MSNNLGVLEDKKVSSIPYFISCEKENGAPRHIKSANRKIFGVVF